MVYMYVGRGCLLVLCVPVSTQKLLLIIGDPRHKCCTLSARNTKHLQVCIISMAINAI